MVNVNGTIFKDTKPTTKNTPHHQKKRGWSDGLHIRLLPVLKDE